MVFAQYSYREFHNGNKDSHPIKSWTRMINDNYIYCSKMNLIKWVEFYFWYSLGRFEYCELPSFHYYWKIKTRKDKRKRLIELIDKYDICKKNPDQIKFLFNRDTTLKTIEDKIEKLKMEI